MNKTVVIGFGNFLMGDDGVGIHAVHKLNAISLPEDVVIIDGGVNAFAALSYTHNATKAFFIDALAGGGRPGDIYRLTADDLTMVNDQALSVHDFSLAGYLQAEKQLRPLPPITIYGIEPNIIQMGIQLSPEVSTALDTLIRHLLKEIA